MCRSLWMEAARLAGRMVVSGSALLFGRWREGRNGEEGAGIGAQGARVSRRQTRQAASRERRNLLGWPYQNW